MRGYYYKGNKGVVSLVILVCVAILIAEIVYVFVNIYRGLSTDTSVVVNGKAVLSFDYTKKYNEIITESNFLSSETKVRGSGALGVANSYTKCNTTLRRRG